MKEIVDITPYTQEEIMLAAFRKAVEENGNAMYTLNQKRYQDIQKAFDIIWKLIHKNDADASIEMVQDPLGKNDWGIVFTTTDLTIQTMEMLDFKQAINLADNFEVYPIKGKRIKGSLAFNEVMEKRT